MREGTSLHLLAKVSAGVCASISCAPFDVLKSRIMVEPHKYPNGLWQCLQEVLRRRASPACLWACVRMCCGSAR